MSEVIIEVKHVSKSFKNIPIFDDVTISFESGKCYGLVGYNGSGKSVFFKMLCQFIRPDTGEIIISNKFLSNKGDYPQNFGIIIDRPGFIGNKTGYENLKELASIKNEISDQKIKDTMHLLGINPDLKQKMKNYSLGMKQKIALAQAIMENQSVLILDEPFNGLDSSSVNNVRDIIIDLKKQNKTILLTSHNQEDLDILCDEIYMIDQHKFVKK